MELLTEELPDQITLVTLRGSLDLVGTEEIALKMSVLAGSRARVLVESSGLTFLSSMGIRSLLGMARAVARRGGRVVVLNPIPAVEKVLVTTGCDAIMPIAHERNAAMVLLSG